MCQVMHLNREVYVYVCVFGFLDRFFNHRLQQQKIISHEPIALILITFFILILFPSFFHIVFGVAN